MALVSNPKSGDDVSVRQAIARLGSTKLGPGSTPTFAGVTTTTLTISGLTTDSLIYPVSGLLTSLGVAANGQIPIGSVGTTPVLATITGTAKRVTVTNGAGTITLSGPQDLDTVDSPTFAGATLTDLTQGSVLFAGTSGVVSQDNSNLFWDDTNNRLGIGVNTGFDPRTGITISGDIDILHTSSEADDHAFEIDADAAGYGDVKAIDINYITGDIALGEDEGIILINIDKIAATGGDVFGLEVLTTEGAAGSTATVYGLKAGVLVGPVHQDSGTFVNPAIGTNDTPQTPVANMIDGDSGPTKRTTIFVAVDDYIIIGATAAFQEIEIILTTPTSNPGIKPTFWYSTGGSGFTQFTPVDGTNGFRNTGVIAWDADDLTGHAVNADTGAANTYDIKIIRTKSGALSPSPILGYAKTAATTEYIWDEAGDVNIKSLVLTTDLAIAHGGTGASTAQTAINALSAVSGATNEHVLTKDTGTGNAIFKAVAAGADVKVGVDVGATADYLGAANNDGALRTDGSNITYTDGGNFVTLTTAQGIQTISTPQFARLGLGNAAHASIPLHISDGNAVNAALITSVYGLISAYDTAPGFSIVSAGPDSTDRAVFQGIRSDGTLASPTVPAVNDLVLSFLGSIYDGTDTEGTAAVDFIVDGTVSSNVAPQRIALCTSETNSASRLERLVVKNTGCIGINTATVPHLGVGSARFAIDGPVSSVGQTHATTGPHVQFTVHTDSYPVLQILNYAHDNINLNFDSYFDGDWKSSDAGSSFSIVKTSDALRFRWDVAAAGGAITWNDGIIMNNAGAVVIAGTVSTGVITQSGTTLANTYHPKTTVGIADNNLVEMDDADAAANDYCKLTANGIVGQDYSEVLGDLSGQAGAAFAWNSQNLTGVGAIGCGVVTGTGAATFEGASVTIGKASTTTGTLVLHDSLSANTITLTVPDISAGSLTFTLPPTDGANTNVLQTDGNGVLTWAAAGSGANHAILDGSVHTDSVADAVTRGSIIYGNATPKWDELVLGAANTFLGSDGTDLSYISLGLWTTPSFNAGDFTAGGSQTWTVAAGDVTTYQYMIIGKTMYLNYYLVTTTVGGTPHTELRIAIPASKTAAKTTQIPGMVNNAGQGNFGGMIAINAGGTYLILYRNLVPNTWAASTNATNVFGSVVFEIQ